MYDQLAKSLTERECSHVAVGQPMTLLERTNLQITQAQTELARLTELKALLEQHPETQRILELLTGRF